MRKLVALVLCCVLVLSLAACTSSEQQAKVDNTDKELEEAVNTLKNLFGDELSSSDSDSSDSDSWDWGLDNSNKVAEPVDPKTVDYSKIDVEFGFDDGDKMKDFMSGAQNGDYDNKVIHITGLMSSGMMDPTTNNVMLKVGDGAKLGFSWRIVDANDSTVYPEDGNKIELTGVMLSEYIADWGMYGHYMYVLPENVKDLGYPED